MKMFRAGTSIGMGDGMGIGTCMGMGDGTCMGMGMGRVISIEGNIGAGKSTLLHELASRVAAGVRGDEGDTVKIHDGGRLRGRVLRIEPEPVDEWCAPRLPNGRSLLQTFYDDRQSNAFAFQMFVLLSRLRQMDRIRSEGTRDTVTLIERCVDADAYLFGSLISKPDQKAVYAAWYDYVMSRNDAPVPDASVYLRCSVDVCHSRVAHRARRGEEHIELDYLQLLHEAHEHWLSAATAKSASILVLDSTDASPAELADAIERFIVDRVDKN